jgi:mono/diheme cytochrome c family protein
MSRPLRALLIVAAVAAVTAPLAACVDEQLLDPMAERQPREKAFRVSNFWEDGLSMRSPPAGTVPRERRTMSPTLTAGIAGYTGQVAPNGERVVRYAAQIPLPVTKELLALGRKRYDITCATCHGPVGDGDSIVARQMALRPPPSLLNYADRAPGYIFEVATHGFGLMASYAAELSVPERWAVVAYIRALQVSQSFPADKLQPDERQRLDQEAP